MHTELYHLNRNTAGIRKLKSGITIIFTEKGAFPQLSLRKMGVSENCRLGRLIPSVRHAVRWLAYIYSLKSVHVMTSLEGHIPNFYRLQEGGGSSLCICMGHNHLERPV